MITGRPLALGYIRETVLTSDNDVADARRALVEFAERAGYALGTVYVEGVERTPVAFQALVASVIREEALAVAVPGPHPVAMIGAASDIRGRCALDGPTASLPGAAGYRPRRAAGIGGKHASRRATG